MALGWAGLILMIAVGFQGAVGGDPREDSWSWSSPKQLPEAVPKILGISCHDGLAPQALLELPSLVPTSAYPFLLLPNRNTSHHTPFAIIPLKH